jgi:hypothetical protein
LNLERLNLSRFFCFDGFKNETPFFRDWQKVFEITLKDVNPLICEANNWRIE